MIDKSNSQQATQIIDLIENKKSNYWVNMGKSSSLKLFYQAAERVPAYKDFLKKNKIDYKKIKTWQDFMQVPVISKKNYIREYTLPQLCWDGKLNNPAVLTATSGSTGEPSYFLRQENLDWQYSIYIEQYLKNNKVSIKEPTLVILGFGMGIWIGGLITYKAFELVAIRNNYPISVITPGINKKEIFNALRKIAPYYSQTILIGYAPFIKDILDEAKIEKVNLENYKMRFLFAAEAITEEVRDYMSNKVLIDNLYLDFMNIYGSADIGAMAVESVTGILVKRLAYKSKSLFKDLFSDLNKSFTLAQFNPLFTNFEDINGEIVLTGNNTIPLIRYSIGDNGGVMSFDELNDKLESNGINLENEATKVGIKKYLNQLPFVYVYERRDFSTSFYGINVLPDWVRGALMVKPLIDTLTGKFTLITKYDKEQNQFLEINLELRKGQEINSTFKKNALKKIIAYMINYSSEYRELVSHLKVRAYPVLQFWKSEDVHFFRPGVKQKWVEK